MTRLEVDLPAATGAASAAFGLRLLERLADAAPHDDVVLAPISVYSALATVREGAAGRTREALDEVLGREREPAQVKAEAHEQLAASVEAFRAAGAVADGTVVADDPIPALAEEVARGGVREIVVVTYPHAVEDTFHRDWASRARDRLRVPVLHLYAGTSELG